MKTNKVPLFLFFVLPFGPKKCLKNSYAWHDPLPLPSKMGLGKNFGKKSVGQGQKIFDFTGGLCYGRSIFPGGDQMIFLGKWKIASSQYQKQQLLFTLNGPICIKELIRCIRVKH